MKSIELNGSARSIAERSSEQARAIKAMRKLGNIPCVLYGGKENVNFSVKESDLQKLIYTPHIYVVDLIIDGVKRNAVLKEVQFHPVKDTVLHVDFYEIDEAKPIVMNVPIELVGLAPGVQAGGRMHQQMRRIAVRAQYTAIPEKLPVKVTSLTLGKSIKVGELSFEGLEIVSVKEAVVCSVKMTRSADAAAAAAAVNTPNVSEAPATEEGKKE